MRVFFFFAAFAWLLLFHTSSLSQALCETELDKRVNIRSSRADVEDTLIALTYGRLPISFVDALEGFEYRTVDLNLRHQPLRSVLDEIVAQLPAHRWSCGDGIVRLDRIQGVDSLTDTLIPRGKLLSNDASDFSNAIVEIPEIRLALNQSGFIVVSFKTKANGLNSSRVQKQCVDSRQPIEHDALKLADLLDWLAKNRRISYWSIHIRQLNSDSRTYTLRTAC